MPPKRDADEAQASGSNRKLIFPIPGEGAAGVKQTRRTSLSLRCFKVSTCVCMHLYVPVTDAYSFLAFKAHCDASNEPTCYELKLLFFQAGNPNGKTLPQIKPRQISPEEHIFKVYSNDSLASFLARLEPKAKREVGGVPADWKIACQADGASATYFKNMTLIDIHDESDNGDAEDHFQSFLSELKGTDVGYIHVTLRTNGARPGDVAKPKKAGGSSIGAMNASNIAAPLMQGASQDNEDIPEGIKSKLSALLKKYICRQADCPWSTEGEKYCWLPYWLPGHHMKLDFGALKSWAAALDKSEKGVTINIPPKIPAFLPSPSSATGSSTLHASIKPVINMLATDEDSDFEVLSYHRVPELPMEVKKEPGTAGSGDNVTVKKEPVAFRPFYINDSTMPKYGPMVTLDAFGIKYGVPEETIDALKNKKFTTPHAVAEMDEEDVQCVNLERGERRVIRTAMELWRMDGRTAPVAGPSKPRSARPGRSSRSKSGSSSTSSRTGSFSAATGVDHSSAVQPGVLQPNEGTSSNRKDGDRGILNSGA